MEASLELEAALEGDRDEDDRDDAEDFSRALAGHWDTRGNRGPEMQSGGQAFTQQILVD